MASAYVCAPGRTAGCGLKRGRGDELRMQEATYGKCTPARHSPRYSFVVRPKGQVHATALSGCLSASSRRDGTFYRCSPCRIPFGRRLSADAVSGSRSDERDETCQLRADPAGVEPASWLDQCSSICIRCGSGLRHPLILGRGDKGSRDNPLSRPGARLFPARLPAPDVVPRAFPPAVAASGRCPVRARSFRSRLPNAKPRAFRLRTPRPSRTPRRRSPRR